MLPADTEVPSTMPANSRMEVKLHRLHRRNKIEKHMHRFLCQALVVQTSAAKALRLRKDMTVSEKMPVSSCSVNKHTSCSVNTHKRQCPSHADGLCFLNAWHVGPEHWRAIGLWQEMMQVISTRGNIAARIPDQPPKTNIHTRAGKGRRLATCVPVGWAAAVAATLPWQTVKQKRWSNDTPLGATKRAVCFPSQFCGSMDSSDIRHVPPAVAQQNKRRGSSHCGRGRPRRRCAKGPRRPETATEGSSRNGAPYKCTCCAAHTARITAGD